MNILWLGLERELGIEHEHSVLILNKDTFSIEKVMNFHPDIVIEREFNDGKHLWEDELAHIHNLFPECKRAVWFIDTHVQKYRHVIHAQNFDYVFLAISEFLPEFTGTSYKKFWLPLCYPAVTMPEKQIKKYAIGFVGRFNVEYLEERTSFLRQIKKQYGELCHFVTDYSTVYKTMSQCTIMLNKSYSNDLNFRVFEALACDNLLVTNGVPDLYKVKGLQDKVFIYKTTEGAIELIKNIMKEKPIIKTSYYIKKYHTITHRIKAMLSMIKENKQFNFS